MENKRFKTLKRKPNGRPTMVTVFDGQKQILEVWVSHELVVKEGKTEEQSTVHAKAPKWVMDFYGGHHRNQKDPSQTIRVLVASAILTSAYGQQQSLRFGEVFAEVVLKRLPVSRWRFNETDLFTGIMECQQHNIMMRGVFDLEAVESMRLQVLNSMKIPDVHLHLSVGSAYHSA